MSSPVCESLPLRAGQRPDPFPGIPGVRPLLTDLRYYRPRSRRQIYADLDRHRHLRSDNGSEFVSRAILRWLASENINTALIDPGKPWQNGTNESFNGKFRDECLSMQWFKNRIDAKILIEQFRREYNEGRPHSSLGQLTPVEFKRQLTTTAIPEGAIS